MKKWIAFMGMALFMTLSVASSCFCGFVLTETDGSRTLMSEGRITSISDDPMEERMILHLGEGVLTVLDPEERTAARGTIDQYCAAMKRMADRMAQSMKRMKEQMKAQGMSDMSLPVPGGEASVEEVRVERAGSGGNIAGYATQKFRVYADGDLYEELWVATDKGLLREVSDMEALARFSGCASRMMGGETVESSAEYKRLMQSGWVLKSIEHDNGYSEVMVEVKAIDEKSIPDTEFEIPAGYEETSLDRLFGMQ